MAGSVLFTEVNFPYTTGLPRDVAINTFWWWCPDGTSIEDGFTNAIAKVIAFYNVAGAPGGNPLYSYFGTKLLDRDQAHIQTGVATGSGLIFTDDIALSEADTSEWPDEESAFPPEVACCISWAAADSVGNTLPIRNRRGRIYLGPLNLTASVDGDRPSDTFIQDAADAAEQIAGLNWDGSDLSDEDAYLVVLSRVASWTNVVNGIFVDDEWDTQRRRGRQRTKVERREVGPAVYVHPS